MAEIPPKPQATVEASTGAQKGALGPPGKAGAASAVAAGAKPGLGAILRNRRKAAGLRLVDLAERSGLSTSYLSQVEHDRICPSIVALGRIAQSLGSTVASIFAEIDEGPPAPAVVRASERKTIMFPSSSIRNELLVPHLQGALEVMWSRIPPGAQSPVFCHDGEECGIVLSGTLIYWVGGEAFTLSKGDAITHNSRIPHRYENRTAETVETIWVITPPGF